MSTAETSSIPNQVKTAGFSRSLLKSYEVPITVISRIESLKPTAGTSSTTNHVSTAETVKKFCNISTTRILPYKNLTPISSMTAFPYLAAGSPKKVNQVPTGAIPQTNSQSSNLEWFQ